MDLAEVFPALERDLLAGCLGAYSDVLTAPAQPRGVTHHDGVIPTIDCGDLLIVQITNVTTAFQGPAEFCVAVPQVQLTATITRCVPNLTSFGGGVADQKDLSAAALDLAADASTLWHGVVTRCMNGTLWPSFSGLRCGDVTFRDMRPGALGGIGWYSWNVIVAVTAALLEDE